MTSKRQIALIHVAKSRLRLRDDEYRAILRRVAGVDSSKDLDRIGFEAVIGYFEYLGFEPLGAVGAHYGARPGMATPAQVQLVRDLWREFSGGFEARALDRWLARSFGVGSLRFLDAKKVAKVIAALKAMKARSNAAKAG